MYSLPSASKICEPCPRRMKGASPPTERKARTGELTPPGIICSARCCNLRDISVLRAMGSPKGKLVIYGNSEERKRADLAVRGVTPESRQAAEFTGYLQSRNSPATRTGYSDSSTRPSNREGFKDSFGGLRAVLLYFCGQSRLQDGPPSLQIGAHQADQILTQLFGRLHLVIRIHHVQADVVLQDLSHQAVDTAANRGQQHQDVRTLIPGGKRAFDGCELAAYALDAEQKLLFLF